MKAIFEYWEEDKTMELSKENLKKFEAWVEEQCGEYSNYVVASCWDDEYDTVRFYADGPWEC